MQGMRPIRSCNLGSINVSKFDRKDRTDLDWRSLAKNVKFAVRFLDDVIDANHWPVAQIASSLAEVAESNLYSA
jgi:ribonucleoside-diphosphate reductase alpha chain